MSHGHSPGPSPEEQDAIEAAFVEAVYDAARHAHSQRLGRERLPTPSDRARMLLRRVRKGVTEDTDLADAASRLAGQDIDPTGSA
jgi:hypothetical protein